MTKCPACGMEVPEAFYTVQHTAKMLLTTEARVKTLLRELPSGHYKRLGKNAAKHRVVSSIEVHWLTGRLIERKVWPTSPRSGPRKAKKSKPPNMPPELYDVD